MLENVRLSFKGIWSHKMRSFLTMLGIIIGIAAIIAIVSTIQGTNEQIKENLIGSGTNTVSILINQGDYPMEFDEYTSVPDGLTQVSDATMKKLAKIDHVTGVSRYVYRTDYGSYVYHLSNTLSGGKIMGVDDNYFSTNDYVIMEGRGFVQKDYDSFAKVAVLDEDSAESLFPGEEAVGHTIEISGEPFTVVGLITEGSTFEPTITDPEDYYTYYEETSGIIYIPRTSWCIPFSYDEPENVVLRVESTDDMTAAGKSAADILNAAISPSDDTIKYKAEDLLEQAKEIQQLSESTNSMLIWIAGISLLVGGIGVMNIMLVTVTERTQEIGLKKAIGARKSRILGQFLTEAAVLTSLGGVIGVGAGIVLAQVISRLTSTPTAISIPATLIAVGFSMLIGIIFGLFPAVKAANLNPIEALRHE